MQAQFRFRESNSKRILIIFCVWLLSLLGGISLLAWYSNKAGERGSPPKSLPKTIPVTNKEKEYQLFMFVHPKCSCTRASIRELKRLLTHCQDAVSCTFFCFRPSETSAEWAQTEIGNSLTDIPDSKIIPDVDAKWARSMGIKTSGHVLLYDTDHHLKFSGGITIRRGHEGTSLASEAMRDLVRNRLEGSYQFPVFGCPIVK